jgi:CheY-like chemotaxis protein
MNVPTVLLAEDDEQINEMLSDFLTGCGYGLVSVFDGLEAIAALLRSTFDCAVLDLMMPGADGSQVLTRMEEIRPELVERTIVISAYPVALPPTQAAAVAAVLQKPFDVETMGRHVHRCIAASRAHPRSSRAEPAR